jgi:hypothetical protein
MPGMPRMSTEHLNALSVASEIEGRAIWVMASIHHMFLFLSACILLATCLTGDLCLLYSRWPGADGSTTSWLWGDVHVTSKAA